VKYKGNDAEYPFPIPVMLCSTFNWMAGKLGIKIEKLKEWEANGALPTRTRTGIDHDRFWTDAEAKEACIKALILMRGGR